MANVSRRRGMNPILAFLLGFLFGIIFLIGAVAGAIYFALNYKLDNIDANKDGDGNYIYINADSENGGAANILELISKVSDMAKDVSSLTIGQVEDLLPVTNKLTDSIYNALDKFVELDKQEINSTCVSELGNYFKEKIMDIEVADVMDQIGGGLSDNEIINLILYDENDNPVTIRQLANGEALDALNDKKVKDIVGESDELTDEILGDLTLGELFDGSADFEGIINGLAVGTLIDVTPDDKILSFIAYGVTEVEAGDGEYPYSGLYHPQDGEPQECFIEVKDGIIDGVFIAESGEQAEKITVSTISSQVSRLTSTLKIKDLLTIDDSNKILSKVKNSTLDGLPDYINNLAINELYADNIYGSDSSAEDPEKAELYLAVKGGVSLGEKEIAFNPAYVYYVNDNGEYKLVNAGTDNAGKLTEEEFENNTYYTYGEANAMWKLLLYSEGSEKTYSVNSITDMITNVTANTQKTTMRELHEAGIMSFEKPEELDYEIPGWDRTIGEVTLEELVSLVVSMSSPKN